MQAVEFRVGVIGYKVCHNHTRFVQPDIAFGGPFLTGRATDQFRLRVTGLQRGTFTNEGTQFGHLSQNHGDNFQRIDFVGCKFTLGFGLYDQNAQLFAQTLDRHTQEAGINLFPCFRHVAETTFRRRIGGVDQRSGLGDATNQTFAHTHARLVDRFGLQTFGGAKLKGFFVAEQIDRAYLGSHGIRGEVRNLVQSFLPRGLFGHGITQTSEQFTTFAFGTVRHA